MTWAIVTDSSCNMRSFTPTAPECIYRCAPLAIHVDGEEFIDDEALDVPELNARVRASKSATSSSCPSAGEWAELFYQADQVIAIPISSQLSGSYEAACMAKTIVMDEHRRAHHGSAAGKDIFILDSKSAGGQIETMVIQLDRYLKNNNPTFSEAVRYVEHLQKTSQVLYSLSSYDNLVKNGRMPKMVGSIAGKLNIRMLGTASAQGTIKIVGPTRGEKKTFRKIVDTMAGDGYAGGLVCIDHVEHELAAQELAACIKETWPSAEVILMPCRGLCSYYAEQSGLIIGYSWNNTSE